MTIDYKVRIEGTQYGFPTEVTLFSIRKKLRSVKGIQKEEITSLYLDFNGKQILKVSGRQLGAETNLEFSNYFPYKVTGKKAGEDVNLKLSYADREHIQFWRIKQEFPNDSISIIREWESLHEPKKIRIIDTQTESDITLKFEESRILSVTGISNSLPTNLNLVYEKLFVKSQHPYRSEQGLSLPEKVKVDTKTLIDYFIFLN